jgi:hypothetical protein
MYSNSRLVAYPIDSSLHMDRPQQLWLISLTEPNFANSAHQHLPFHVTIHNVTPFPFPLEDLGLFCFRRFAGGERFERLYVPRLWINAL